MVGTGTASVSVIFSDLEIEGARARRRGAGRDAALGGGLLIDGGQVTLSNVKSRGTIGGGAAGATGAAGGKRGQRRRWRRAAGSTWPPAN